MMSLRFLHTSDWQLGMTRAFLSEQGQSRYTDDQFEAIRTLSRLADDRKCAFVVVAGDVFDSIRPTRQIINKSIDVLADFSVPVLLLPGNHDANTPAGIWSMREFTDRLPTGVTVIQDTTPVSLPGGTVEVVGAPWPSRRPDVDLLARALANLEPTQPGVVRVAVGHGAVNVMSPDPLNPALISLAILENAIEDRRVSYVALGDRHSATEVGRAVWYSGSPVATDYGEVNSNHALIVDLDGDSVSVDAVSVGTWRFLERNFDLAGHESVELVGRFLEELGSKERTAVKLGLVGTLGVTELEALEKNIERARDLLAGLQLSARRSEIKVVADTRDLTSLNLSGFARDAMAELMSQAESQGTRADVAQDALMLLARLASRST